MHLQSTLIYCCHSARKLFVFITIISLIMSALAESFMGPSRDTGDAAARVKSESQQFLFDGIGWCLPSSLLASQYFYLSSVRCCPLLSSSSALLRWWWLSPAFTRMKNAVRRTRWRSNFRVGARWRVIVLCRHSWRSPHCSCLTPFQIWNTLSELF